MALEECNNAITQALGRELTDREKGAVARKASELKQKIDLANGDVESVLKNFGDGIARDQAIARRNAAINFRIAAEKDAERKASAFAKGNPSVFAKAKFVQTQKNYRGAKDSLGTEIARTTYSSTSAYTADLMKANLFDYAFKSGDDKNIWLARQALNDPNVDAGNIEAQYGKNAVGVAKINKAHQDYGVQQQNKYGAWIGQNADYVTRQSAQPEKLAKSGGNAYGSVEAKEDWASKTYNRMDWSKSFDGELATASQGKRLDRLRSQWTQFVAGKHLNWEDGGGGPGMQNFAAKSSQERQLVFKAPSDGYDNWKEFGSAGSLAESTWHDLERSGKNTAILKQWGPNAQANVKSYLDRAEKEVVAEGNPAKLQDFQKARKTIEQGYLPVYFGHLVSPDADFAAHYLSTARQTLLAARTALSMPSQLGDFALKGSYAQRFGDKNMLGEIGRSVGGVLKGMSENDRQTYAKEFGIRLHDLNVPLGEQYAELAGTGKWSKFLQTVMKASGLSFAHNRGRLDTLAAEGYRQWSMKDQPWNQLDEGRRDLMSRYGMDEKQWDLIRSSEPGELENGDKAFMPSKIRGMDPQNFKAMASGDSAAALGRARDTVADNYRNMLGDLADTITSEPNANMRAIIYGPTVNWKPWQKELYRGFFGLKGFVTNYMRNHLGGIALGGDADPSRVGWTKAMMRTMTGMNGGKSAVQLYSLIGAGVGLGYMKNALHDVASGQSPQDPTDWKSPTGDWRDAPGAQAMERAFAFQSFGLLSDSLLARGKPNADVWDQLGGLAGPEAETAGDLIDTTLRTGHHIGKWAADKNYTDEQFYKDFGKDAASYSYTAYHAVPGTDLPFVKAAGDYYLLDNWMDMLNPGYKQRVQKRLQGQGQTTFLANGQ